DLQNGRIRKIGPDGRITTLAGGGARAIDAGPARATDVRLKAPRNVTVDDAGNVYLSDFSDHRVLRVTPDGQIAPFAGSGTQGAAGDNGPALQAQLAYPCGLAVDKTGALYIADSANHAIRRVYNGVMTTVAISASASYVNLPTGVAVDNLGGLFVASSGFDQ